MTVPKISSSEAFLICMIPSAWKKAENNAIGTISMIEAVARIPGWACRSGWLRDRTGAPTDIAFLFQIRH
jgi:hypothetical protein